MMYPINHPMADEISIIDHEHSYSSNETKEIAFFLNDEWVTDILPEFEEHTPLAPDGDTRVYGWVPTVKINAFMEKFSV